MRTVAALLRHAEARLGLIFGRLQAPSCADTPLAALIGDGALSDNFATPRIY
jgi:hypothetical protein